MRCKKFKEKIILYLYGELDEKEKADLESHIKECPECKQDFEYTREVFKVLDDTRPEPTPEANWEKCWNGIGAGIHKKPRKEKSFFMFPRWVYAFGAVFIIFVMGIFLGRFAFHPGQSPVLQAGITKDYLDFTLKEHIENLKPVLIEYANYSSSDQEEGTITIDKEVVRSLLIQNILLKRIIAKKSPPAEELLEDVDIVLREISNHKKEDIRTPSLIKDLIYQRDIFFKMETLQKI